MPAGGSNLPSGVPGVAPALPVQSYQDDQDEHPGHNQHAGPCPPNKGKASAGLNIRGIRVVVQATPSRMLYASNMCGDWRHTVGAYIRLRLCRCTATPRFIRRRRHTGGMSTPSGVFCYTGCFNWWDRLTQLADTRRPRACYDEGKRVAESLCYAYAQQEKVQVCHTFRTHSAAVQTALIANRLGSRSAGQGRPYLQHLWAKNAPQRRAGGQ